MSRRRLAPVLAAALALALPAATAPAFADDPAGRPTAAVSMGDSYISGEAGRWQGNSVVPAGDRSGTDRGEQAYGSSGACHRSDTAPIQTAELRVDERINLACSGAQTRNVLLGGTGQHGEPPQAQQLAAVAQAKDVRLVALSIGGNDLGFSSIVSACLQAYLAGQPPCQASQQAAIDGRFPKAMADVARAIDDVRTVMARAGKTPDEYRLVVQSYPSAIARGTELRPLELDRASRGGVDGCPVYDSDATWARDRVVHQIAEGLRAVAKAKSAQFLDLRDLFQGHEMCARTTRLATPLTPPSPLTSDWARFLNVPAVVTQGVLAETFHPNAFGQRAQGRCLGLAAQRGFDVACTAGAGKLPEQAEVAKLVG